jgi:hypothetical protein
MARPTQYSYRNAEEEELKLTKCDDLLWHDIRTKSDENQLIMLYTIDVHH